MIAELGVDKFPPFLGFKGIFKGDEPKLINGLERIKYIF